MMRKISELIWHCTATPEGREVSVAEITEWHRQRGWKTIGYHKVVHLDGSVENGRPESQIGAHVAGHNTGTIGYVYVGGVKKDGKTPKDTRTDAQKATMLRLTKEAVAKYGLTKVSGHRDYAAKACPCFDARKEYGRLVLNSSAGMPARDPAALTKSRTMQGSGAAGLGIIGSTLSEAAAQIEPLAYYSEALKWVFILISLAGIGYVIWTRMKEAGVGGGA